VPAGVLCPLAPEPERDYTPGVMQPQKAEPMHAVVRNGRLVLDEPTDLPEGEVIELVSVDHVLANGGDLLDDEERELLHESLHESIKQAEAGQVIDADLFLAELRARR
jgi:hypothetical protein